MRAPTRGSLKQIGRHNGVGAVVIGFCRFLALAREAGAGRVHSSSASEWSRAIYVHHSDNLLDNRPALVSTKPGELLIIHSSDGRRRFIPMSYMPGIRTSLDEETPIDPYQNDLYMSRITLTPAPCSASCRGFQVTGRGLPNDHPEFA